jgi:HSP20 family protein
MDWKKLSPWNWFKNEQQQGPKQQVSSGQVPVQRNLPSIPSTEDNTFMAMHQRMQNLFDEFSHRLGMPAWPSMPGPFNGGFLRPSIDIKGDKNQYTLSLELPGVERDEVQLEVEGDTLVISGEKRQEKDNSEENYHFVERHYGAFQRVLSLPTDADADNIRANFKNGVLRVTIGRREEAREGVKRISVE